MVEALSDGEIDRLLSAALRCRRLARETTDARTARALMELATENEDKVREAKILAKQPDNDRPEDDTSSTRIA